ncbi:NADPH-dependent FMN reductase [Streptomyces sp. NPDC059063]|uniref:NADPH-dependent FMN reductase n=1 Tax=unclassified Streptomyces TaxID=2593676 RepID=UPI0036BEF08C
MMRLIVLTASIRPGRVGPAVAEWFTERAREHGGFEVDPVDLADLGLPFHDEPEHPMTGRYVHDHSKAWSARVAAADAFVFVMPEYNYSFSAPLKNAIDFLYHEWAYKPVGFVSYGNTSGGIRAVQMIKQVVTTLSMMPLTSSVIIQHIGSQLDASGQLLPSEDRDSDAKELLDELQLTGPAFASVRAAGPTL